MKKILISTFILCIAFASLHAQDEKLKDRQERERKPVQRLNFSEEQKQKMKSYNQDFRKQMEELRKNEDITVREYRNHMESLRKSHQEQIKGLFTPEQKRQIERARTARKANLESRMQKNTERMKSRIGLNDDQVKRLTEERKVMAEKRKLILQNQAFSREQKREEMRDLMEKRKAEMKSLLSEEQLQKMKQLKKAQKRKQFYRQPI